MPMSRKGEKIGEKSVVLRRSTGVKNSQNVYNQIDVSDLDVEHGQTVYVLAAESHGGTGWASGWYCDVYESSKEITLPKDKVEGGNLRPGDTVLIDVYEQNPNATAPDSIVIERVEAKPRSNCDGVQSYLSSNETVKYVKENGNDIQLCLRNVNNSYSCFITPEIVGSHSTRIKWTKEKRNKLDVEAGDLIEIIPVGNPPESNESENESDELYEMVSEMYDAYLESKNA